MSDKLADIPKDVTSERPKPKHFVAPPKNLPMVSRTRKTFISSDLHLFHAGVIKISGRPYKIVEPRNDPANIPVVNQMDEDIMKQFDILPPDCDVWNLGDVFHPLLFKEKPEQLEQMKTMVKRMKGESGTRRLFLVLGNHDKGRFPDGTISEFYRSLGFDQVFDSPVIVDNKYILSHRPVYLEKGSPMINLYGHTHDYAIQENFFTFDYKAYVDKYLNALWNGTEKPELEILWPEREVDLANYRNMCIDHNKGILEWDDDTFTVVSPVWS